MTVGVIYGGESTEREVSKKTGEGVIRALTEKGYSVKPIFFTDNKDLVQQMADLKVDLVYIALHGKYGEDGRVQGLLDLLKIPYIGSGVLASALAMDKHKAKQSFVQAGIRTAKEVIINKDSQLSIEKPWINLSLPLVIKPNSEGSTIGITIARSEEEVVEGIETASQYDSVIMVEEFIEGIEVTVGVMGKGKGIKALPVIEIVPKNPFYDYESKYAPGMSDHIIPARISQEMTEKCQSWAVLAHQVLGCRTFSRVDFIVPKDGSDPVILEVNTLPGMTETSLFPDAARAIGMDYSDMIDQLVKITLNK
ncbi:D-alanine--D-alanine ligase [Microaerobacter geothermalis]|nr:D-alanine--D-alanine ligase [Microaerobacter geothermalis]